MFKERKIKKILGVNSLDNLNEYDAIKKLINLGLSTREILGFFPTWTEKEITCIRQGYVLKYLANGQKHFFDQSFTYNFRQAAVNALNDGLTSEQLQQLIDSGFSKNILSFNRIVDIILSQSFELTNEQLEILLSCGKYKNSYGIIEQVYRAFKMELSIDEVTKLLPPFIKETAYMKREDKLEKEMYNIILNACLMEYAKHEDLNSLLNNSSRLKKVQESANTTANLVKKNIITL